MANRPILIAIGTFTEMSPNILVALVWLNDTLLDLLFYYILFKMKVVQIILEQENKTARDLGVGMHSKPESEYDEMVQSRLQEFGMSSLRLQLRLDRVIC